jgi:hypothetical protein
MRMARVNISLPDELFERAREAGINVSRTASAALAEELDRRAKVAELESLLGDLDRELGPIPAGEAAAAKAWADQVLPAPGARPRSA